MKSVVKPLSIITAIAFVVGVIVTAFYLYNLKELLIANSSVLDLINFQEIKPTLQLVTLLISMVLATGLAALVFQVILSASNSKGSLVYVDKHNTDKTGLNGGTEAEEEDQDGNSTYSPELIKKIQQATAELKEPEKLLEFALNTVCNHLEASQGAVYVTKEELKRRIIELRASYAYMKPDSKTVRFEYGEGLAGQVAKEGIPSNISAVPDGYIKILSGLGQATPKHLLLVPVIEKNKVMGVVEIASFTSFTTQHQELTTKIFGLLTSQFAKISEKIEISEETLEHFEDNSQII